MNNNKNYSISIALCTFNGQLFLTEQLKSLAKQTILPAELVICDDASTDLSISAIREFSDQAPFKVSLYENKKRLGPIQNFSKAITLCYGDYVALCDQDDIWLPDKLETMVRFISDAEDKYGSEVPLLVHSDLKVIDEAGKVVSTSFMKLQNIRPLNEEALKTLLVQNFVTGCTVLINRALIDIALPIPTGTVMHDWWLALVAAAAGQIIYVEDPTVLYRQHGDNLVGAKKYFSTASLSRLANLDQMENDLAGAIVQGLLLKKRIETASEQMPLFYLVDFLNTACDNGVRTAYKAWRYGIKKQGCLRVLVYTLLLLRGGYLKKLRSKLDLIDLNSVNNSDTAVK